MAPQTTPETPPECLIDGDEFISYQTPTRKKIIPLQVLVPSIPVRIEQLARALNSVDQQTISCGCLVRLDKDREGACKNRNRLLFEANQEFVAFLDDDDVLYPEHIEELYDLLIKENADVAYSLPKVLSGEYEIPLDCVFGGMKDFSFNPDTLLERNFIPVTVVARRKKLVDAGGFQHLKGYYGEDHGLWMATAA